MGLVASLGFLASSLAWPGAGRAALAGAPCVCRRRVCVFLDSVDCRVVELSSPHGSNGYVKASLTSLSLSLDFLIINCFLS